jgi:hypothetical protein
MQHRGAAPTISAGCARACLAVVGNVEHVDAAILASSAKHAAPPMHGIDALEIALQKGTVHAVESL